MAFDRLKERRKAAKEMADHLREEHPAFATEMEQKYGMGWDLIVQMFLPLIMKWLQDWLDKKGPHAGQEATAPPK